MKKVSLRWKMIVPIIVCVIMGVTVTIFVTGYSARKIVITEIENSTMIKLRDMVLISMTTMMSSNCIKESKSSFITQMKQTADLKVVRSRALDKDYGKGADEEYAQDQQEKEVIDKGVTKILQEGATIRGIYPYIAHSNSLGENCLKCHNVPEGTVLGAVDIRVSLTDSLSRIRNYQYLYGALGILGTILMTAFIYILARYVFSPLEALTGNVYEVKNGNLAISFNHQSGDEIGTLSSSMNEMVQAFRTLIGNISASSNNLVSVINNLSLESQKVSEGSEHEVDQIMQIATANEEMTVTSVDIANNCHLAEISAKQADSMALEGAKVVEQTIRVMSKIAERVTTTARTVESLGSRSDQIGAIVGTIEDIADQTNLLALNAAIEAARAGEQGRGFAVVADEVRALAERTTRATKEISAMIKTIQLETKEAVKSMDEGVHEVENGTQEAARSGEALRGILEQIGTVTSQISQIATAAEEQTATIHEINNNMQIVADVAKTNKEVGKEVFKDVAELTITAKGLKDSTTGFRLN
jgi:methyl-accepting chemotaxis protein